MSERKINKVMVLGASGNIGPAVVEALLAHPAGYQVSVVTRDKKKLSYPSSVDVFESDYSPESLKQTFSGQDAIVSTMAPFSVTKQDEIIDIAIEAKVVRFIPTEYGVDTADPNLIDKFMPIVKAKLKIVEHLKSNEGKISWSAVIVGSFFDWSLATPRDVDWDIPKREAVIYDGGDQTYEATNTAQIGRAVAAVLAPEHQASTANQYVYVNSFTLTQNQLLAALEKATGDEFKVKKSTIAELQQRAVNTLEKDPRAPLGFRDMVVANIYNSGGLNRYSKNPDGLWNERLGLPKEDFQESVDAAVRRYEK